MADGKWQGTDADLETSLFEYGFIAKQRAEKDYPDEWFVLYKISGNAYGTGHIRESELDDLINGKEWMEEKDIEKTLNYVGMTKEEWLKGGFINKLSDLLGYWGYEEIMGADYYPLDKKGALKMAGLDSADESKARKCIEELKSTEPKQPEDDGDKQIGSEQSDIIDDKLNKEVTILQGVLMNRRLGQGAALQTANGAMVNILALGAKNEEPTPEPEKEEPKEEPKVGEEPTAAAKVISAASNICATESYKVSKNEFAIAQKMKAKGYKYAMKVPGDERLLCFKTTKDMSSYLQDEKDLKPEWNGSIEDLTIHESKAQAYAVAFKAGKKVDALKILKEKDPNLVVSKEGSPAVGWIQSSSLSIVDILGTDGVKDAITSKVEL
jgi:hypothetical protein